MAESQADTACSCLLLQPLLLVWAVGITPPPKNTQIDVLVKYVTDYLVILVVYRLKRVGG